MKRFLCLVLVLSMVFCFAACKNNDPTVDIPEDPPVSEPIPEPPKFAVNPLTGLKDLDIGKENLRPVAVMINNIRVAQSVQTGVQKADIIYETEVEGGITRLLAVFKDITKVDQIGTVRSARYDYIDLALGHDAIYVHCGIDVVYATKHVTDTGVASFNINSNPWAAYGFRIKNGLASEHTMYTSSEKLNQGFEALGFRTTTEKPNTFCQFNSPDAPVVPVGEEAYTVSVPFSNHATSVFTYNPETKLYTKNTKGTNNKDYKSGETYDVTNVLVLRTNIGYFADNKHRDIGLSGGKGYYISGGAYQEITWEKGASSNTMKYYNTDGTPLTINAGKTWICIQSNAYTPKFEGNPNAVAVDSAPAQ